MPPQDFHARVLHTIQKWTMLPASGRVGVAVSGGADSVALLRALHALTNQFSCELEVLHVNHKLRGTESDDDARFVQTLADELRLLCKIVELPLTHQGNLEQEARNLRLDWFEFLSLPRIALGHTRSDQAETVLFRFLRGSATAGLAGIHPVLPNGLVRPLFEVGREDTREYLRQIGQPWREDSSNRSLSYDRNRLRLELLPALAKDWNPAIENTLAQTAEWARAEEEHWEDAVEALAQDHLRPAREGSIIADTSELNSFSTAAARRLIRYAIAQVKGNLHGIDFAHVEQLLALIGQSDGSGRVQIPGVDVMRSFDWVRFARPGTYAGDRHFSIPVSVPGEFVLLPAGSALKLQVEDADCRYNDDVDCLQGRLDARSVANSLVLRTWQPGDQYRPKGYSAVLKLKTLFQTARIPLWDRRTWPVLTSGGEIVWSRRFGVADRFAARELSARVVTISERVVDNLITVSPKLESGI